jgi:hypothetical protein
VGDHVTQQTDLNGSERSGGLTPRQEQALPHFAAGVAIERACRAARISKATAYAWLRQPTFRAAVAALREELTDHALDALKAAIGQAVETIATLAADAESETVKLAAARAIIEHVLKVRELEDLAGRLEAVEKAMHGRGRYGTTRSTA